MFITLEFHGFFKGGGGRRREGGEQKGQWEGGGERGKNVLTSSLVNRLWFVIAHTQFGCQMTKKQ